MEARLKHQQAPGCKHTTTVVISDKPNVSGLNKAENLGVTAVVVPLPDVSDKAERRLFHEQEIGEVLADYGAETIILSGYMRILTPSFVDWEVEFSHSPFLPPISRCPCTEMSLRRGI